MTHWDTRTHTTLASIIVFVVQEYHIYRAHIHKSVQYGMGYNTVQIPPSNHDGKECSATQPAATPDGCCRSLSGIRSKAQGHCHSLGWGAAQWFQAFAMSCSGHLHRLSMGSVPTVQTECRQGDALWGPLSEGVQGRVPFPQKGMLELSHKCPKGWQVKGSAPPGKESLCCLPRDTQVPWGEGDIQLTANSHGLELPGQHGGLIPQGIR